MRPLQKEHAESDNPGQKEKNYGRLRHVFEALVYENKTYARALTDRKMPQRCI